MVVEIIGLALAILTAGYQTIVSEFGAGVDHDALKLAKDIASKIGSNNALKEKITNAYNDRNTSLINSLFRGMGFGPRAAVLNKMKIENEKNFQDKINKINKENVELEKYQSSANQASMLGGTSIQGNIRGAEIINDIEQNINGGAIKNE